MDDENRYIEQRREKLTLLRESNACKNWCRCQIPSLR